MAWACLFVSKGTGGTSKSDKLSSTLFHSTKPWRSRVSLSSEALAKEGLILAGQSQLRVSSNQSVDHS